jgi:hypothetical protein
MDLMDNYLALYTVDRQGRRTRRTAASLYTIHCRKAKEDAQRPTAGLTLSSRIDRSIRRVPCEKKIGPSNDFKVLLERRAKRFVEYIRSNEQHLRFVPG